MTRPTETNAAAVAMQTAAINTRRISWGSIFAGLALFFALSWLLLVLGAALGVGIADATDLAAVGAGLGVGSIVWLLITSLVATFAGALLAAKLAGSADDRVGALHGLTLWAVSTLVLLLLGASGIGGAINAVSSAVSSGSQAAKVMVGGMADSDTGAMLPDSVTNGVAATIKRQTSKALSGVAAGGASPGQTEVRTAMNSLSAEDVAAITSALMSGNDRVARDRLANRSTLSAAEIDSIIAGVKTEIQDLEESQAVNRAQTMLEQRLAQAQRAASRSIADLGGAELTAAEVRSAVNEIDADTLTSASGYLIQGKPQQAKDVLVARTSLTEQEVNAIIDGAEQEVGAMVEEAQAQLNETTEAAGTYTQAVLWAGFVAGCLGLVAGLAGGYVGAGTVRRVYPVTAVADRHVTDSRI
ncbi:hypothetical protein [Marinobacter sp. X15-166B]|uniref:hypothetical protein n=1 Tax=Marinobacter sp. X15-166B TaxID=1897620 RepID=UPI00085CD2A6|nr:hypothetical protein [Marinobacter sp. X15-166B]OEY66174.1 hypothetical protein BG841_06680 [Marinobacter sp. X15-166B]